jgi:N6-L-threonylcarbamoyladenine synthase
LPVVQKALETSNSKLETINYIAITNGPGLIPSLIVGVEFVKALSFATGKRVIPVNHMLGHLYSPFGRLNAKRYKLNADLFPMISLIVSGGHTMLVLMKNIRDYKVLGQTVDDAAGEAFDKVLSRRAGG